MLKYNRNYDLEKRKYSLIKNTYPKTYQPKYYPKDTNTFVSDERTKSNYFIVPDEIERLEKEPLEPFCYLDSPSSLKYDLKTGTNLLLHGLRYYNPLENLEGIFQERKILAGKYLNDRFFTQDLYNCNEGKYVSLIESTYDKTLEYVTFIEPYIHLFIRPLPNAYKAHHIPFDDFRLLKDNNIELKNRYSTVYYEYQVEDYISLDDVVAIGFPKISYMRNGIEYANMIQEAIVSLMKRYNVNVPLLDTSVYRLNTPLYVPDPEVKRTPKA